MTDQEIRAAIWSAKGMVPIDICDIAIWNAACQMCSDALMCDGDSINRAQHARMCRNLKATPDKAGT